MVNTKSKCECINNKQELRAFLYSRAKMNDSSKTQLLLLIGIVIQRINLEKILFQISIYKNRHRRLNIQLS